MTMMTTMMLSVNANVSVSVGFVPRLLRLLFSRLGVLRRLRLHLSLRGHGHGGGSGGEGKTGIIVHHRFSFGTGRHSSNNSSSSYYL